MKDKDLEKIYVVRADLAFWSYATIGVATDLKSAKEMAMKFIANYPEITKAVAEHTLMRHTILALRLNAGARPELILNRLLILNSVLMRMATCLMLMMVKGITCTGHLNLQLFNLILISDKYIHKKYITQKKTSDLISDVFLL